MGTAAPAAIANAHAEYRFIVPHSSKILNWRRWRSRCTVFPAARPPARARLVAAWMAESSWVGSQGTFHKALPRQWQSDGQKQSRPPAECAQAVGSAKAKRWRASCWSWQRQQVLWFSDAQRDAGGVAWRQVQGVQRHALLARIGG